MVAIVAVDENWGIGCEGKLLFNIPEDMDFFKRMTEGKTVVMGYMTFLSLPGSKPLKNRNNIVLADVEGFAPEGVTVCGSLDQALAAVSAYAADDVFIIGGQDVYTQFLPHCSRVYVTKINAGEKADRYFPNLDLLDNWSAEGKSEDFSYKGMTYAFYTYVNRNM
jgi:dihydrofolate reductase